MFGEASLAGSMWLEELAREKRPGRRPHRAPGKPASLTGHPLFQERGDLWAPAPVSQDLQICCCSLSIKIPKIMKPSLYIPVEHKLIHYRHSREFSSRALVLKVERGMDF